MVDLPLDNQRYAAIAALQSGLSLVLPHQCVGCGEVGEGGGALCARCWTGMPFIAGAVCDLCGVPLPGDDASEIAHCDDCLTIERPWSRGRAAFLYGGTARRVILGFKHGDRTELADSAARWLAIAGAPLLAVEPLLVPVPIHRFRLLRRKYNQSALLARALARLAKVDVCPDALTRLRRTRVQEGMGREARFANMADAIRPHPRRTARLKDRSVLLIDDVMTSGATLAACAEATMLAGAREVSVLVLARVTKETYISG